MTININTVSYTFENNEMLIVKFWNLFQQFLLFSELRASLALAPEFH